jgi:glycosyltransferase involved in cell wall biosynthesis
MRVRGTCRVRLDQRLAANIRATEMANKLTVLIPCKDERKNIRPCIESIQSIADEILIADSGSTDGTLDIVRDIGGCRIIERDYVHSADFKNWAIPQARHEWVLIVDADERVTSELAAEIQRAVVRNDANVDGYWIKRYNHFLGYRIKRCGWSGDKVLRLFRRDRGRYQPRWVHAEILMNSCRTQWMKHRLLHYTTWDSDQYFAKLNRYAMWGALNARDEGKGPSALNVVFRGPFRFFQLYVLRLGFLDGLPGFQVCMYNAFYAFLKQAKLWEMYHANEQPDPEQADAVSGETLPASAAKPGKAGAQATTCGVSRCA